MLAIEPYGGGSHLAFLKGWSYHSRHSIHLVSLPARHWKWRMRSAPLAILSQLHQKIDPALPPQCVIVSDMLDLPTWLGFASRHVSLRQWIHQVPIVAYFHENQWAYPKAPHAREDHHYAYTNLLTAAAADACWFNSAYNRTTLLDSSADFLKRMPDSADVPNLDEIRSRSRVIVPGFEAIDPAVGNERKKPPTKQPVDPIVIGWVGRFEHDKRPDQFALLLETLANQSVTFELVLLGERGRPNEALQQILNRHGHRVRYNGYAPSREEYWHQLSSMDIVVSTADHEFFGIAMCEAMWAGAVPIVPNRLSYPEYVPETLRYDSLEEAALKIVRLSGDRSWESLQAECRRRIEPFRMPKVASIIDSEIDALTIAWDT